MSSGKSLSGTEVKVIFVGCLWHRHPGCANARTPRLRVEFWTNKLDGNRVPDLRNQVALNDLGWSVLTVWECELSDTDALLQRIRALLDDDADTTTSSARQKF